MPGAPSAPAATAAMAAAAADAEDEIARERQDITKDMLPEDFSSVTHRLALLAHEAVESRLEAITALATEEPSEEWFRVVAKQGQLFWELTNAYGGKLPDTDDIDYDFFMAEQHFPAPRRVVGTEFTESFQLARNFRRGRRSVPRSTVKHPRLAKADTDELLDALLDARIKELASARAEGSLANAISKFMKWRHLAIEGGRRAFRWELFGMPSREVLYQEMRFFMRFIIWGSLFWKSHEVLAQACSAVRTVHRRVAGIDMPIWPEASRLLADCARRMNAEAGPLKDRDFLSNFEMNALQEIVITFLEMVIAARMAGKAVANSTLRTAIKEAGCDLAMSCTREHGSRPGEMLPGDRNFRSKWGGLQSLRNLYWTKWQLAQLDAASDDSVTWLKLPFSKSEWTRSKARQQEILQKVPFLYLKGELGRLSAVAAAKRLYALDELQLGEVAEREPVARDPKHLGGTGKALDNKHFDSHIKAKVAKVVPASDPRQFTGYAVKKSAAVAIKHGVQDLNQAQAAGEGGASIDEAETRRRFLRHAHASTGLLYDCPSVEGMARAAVQASVARYTPARHLAAGDAEVHSMPLHDVLGAGKTHLTDRILGAASRNLGPMQRGWAGDNLEATVAALRPDEGRRLEQNLDERIFAALGKKTVVVEPPSARRGGVTDDEDEIDGDEAAAMTMDMDLGDLNLGDEGGMGPSTQGELRSASLGGVDSSPAWLETMSSEGLGDLSHWAPGPRGQMRLCCAGTMRRRSIIPAACAAKHDNVLRTSEQFRQCTFWAASGTFTQEWLPVADLRARYVGDEAEEQPNPVPQSVQACPARESGTWQMCRTVSASVQKGALKTWTVTCRLQSGKEETHPAKAIWDTRYRIGMRTVGGTVDSLGPLQRAFSSAGAQARVAAAVSPDSAAASPASQQEDDDKSESGGSEQGSLGSPSESSEVGSLSADGGVILSQWHASHDVDGGADSRSEAESSSEDGAAGEDQERPQKRKRSSGTSARSCLDLDAGVDGAGGQADMGVQPLTAEESESFTQDRPPGSQEHVMGRVPRAAGRAEAQRLAAEEDRATAAQTMYRGEPIRLPAGARRAASIAAAAELGNDIRRFLGDPCGLCGCALCECDSEGEAPPLIPAGVNAAIRPAPPANLNMGDFFRMAQGLRRAPE